MSLPEAAACVRWEGDESHDCSALFPFLANYSMEQD